MDFEVSIDEHAEAYSVISVRGEVDLDADPNGAVVLDMGGVAFMDSTALSALVRAKDTLQQQGISLRLASPSKAVERIFSVTGFRDYFDIFPSRQAAIAG